MELKSDLVRCTLLGSLILGIGSRALMRVVALMQGTTPIWTFEGTLTVVALGTVTGLGAGIIYHLLRRFVARPWMRTTAFMVICGLISWRGVHGVPFYQQMMFMALALSYLVIVDVMGRLASRRGPSQHLSFNLTG